MRLARTAALTLALTFALQRASQAQIVETFESFADCDNSTIMTTFGLIDYQSQFMCYSFFQDPFNPHSGKNRLRWNIDNGGPESGDAFFTFFTPRVFDGAWFAGSASAYFELYLNNILVGTTGVLAGSATPAFLNSGYSGNVDKVVLYSDGQAMIMDDITFEPVDGNVVPEPGTMLLLSTGLVGLAIAGFVQRRRTA